MQDQVYIIGAGAIGKALAVFLNAAGRNVVIIRARGDGGADELLALNVELTEGTRLKASVQVSCFSRQKQLDGVIVLANKSIGNRAIAAALHERSRRSPVVVLQNGLNIEQPLHERRVPNIYRCVLFATSQHLTDNTLRFRPVAPSPVGLVEGDSALLPKIVSLLDTRHFRFVAEPNIQPIIWKKVIANCVFNSICPLLETDNGIFYRNDTARSLAVEVISECVSVAQKEGVLVDEAEVLQTVLQISKASEGQLISTLQDIRNRRPTEIDSLNFAVVEKAMQAGNPASVIKTKMLGDLIKLKSDLNLHR